jgi:hypothetical protein
MKTLAGFALTIGTAALFAGCGPEVTVFTPSAGALAQRGFGFATGSTAAPELLISAWRYGRPGPGLLEFAQHASGNVSPMRQLDFIFPPYGEDRFGNFWGGPVHYSVAGRVIGRLLVLQGDVLTAFTLDRNHNVYIAGGPGKPQTCPFTGEVTVNEYAAGAYGQPPPTRYIGLGRPCSIPSITVTGSGNVAVAAVYMKRKRTRFVIREFPARGSGELKPIRVIDLGPVPVSNLAGDARGDIYALIGPSSSNGGTIVEYGPTGAGSQRLGISGNVLGFALGARARIFAALAGIGGTTIAEVDGFRSGSRVLFARLKGKKTRFDGALFIGIAARQ